MSKTSKVTLVSVATPEWHWYCPNCERSNMSRIHDFDNELETMRRVTCSNCGEEYTVKKDTNNHCDQPKVTRIEKDRTYFSIKNNEKTIWINAPDKLLARFCPASQE